MNHKRSKGFFYTGAVVLVVLFEFIYSPCFAEVITTGSSSFVMGAQAVQQKNWNFNLGISQFECGCRMNPETGKGISLDLQRSTLLDGVYLGASYTNFYIRNATEESNLDATVFAGSGSRSSDLVSLYGEFRPINVELQGGFSFFAAADAGFLSSVIGKSAMNSGFFYGIGAGLNFDNQIGFRVDMKSNRDVKNYSSLALTGYF